MSSLTGAKSLCIKNGTVFIATSHGIVFVDVAGNYNLIELLLHWDMMSIPILQLQSFAKT